MTFAALMLAGGESRRMGRPKALLEANGLPLWERQCALLESLGPTERLLSPPAGHALARPGWRPIQDARPGKGPLGGIVAGLEAISVDWLLVLGVDLPSMRADVLQTLLAAAREGAGAVFDRGGFYEPVAAVYSRGTAALARHHLEAGQLGLQALCSEAVAGGLLARIPLPEESADAFHNWNAPSDID